MKTTLRVLIAEDNPLDADLVLRELRKAGFEPDWKRVDTEAGFAENLHPDLDIILSDYAMPQFGGLRALELLKKSGMDVPLIIISGTIGEENAVDAMKHGAVDYLLKDRLARLGPAVKHTLETKHLRTERRRTQQKLQLQAAALHTAASAVVITTSQGTILSVNPAFTTLTGYTAEEAVGQNPRILKSGHHAPAFYKHLWETILSGKTWHGNFTNRHKDGTYYHEESTITPVRADGGAITHFVSIMTDVTARKRAEEELQKQAGQMRLIIEHSPAAIAMFDMEMRYLVASRQWMKAYDLGEKSILGLCHYDVFPEIPGRWKEIHRRCLAGAVEKCDEDAFPRKGGTINWVRWEIHPWHQTDGSIGGIIIFSEDITGRKRAEEELHWKTAFLEAQVHSSFDGILVVDGKGKKLLQNERFNELWHIPRHIAEDPDDTAQVRYATDQTKNPRQFGEKVAYLYAHPDEVSRDEVELVDGTTLDRHSAPVRGKDGKQYGRIWSFRDITERKLLEDQLRQSQKMEAIGQLAGGIAHDFNNLLVIIQGYTEMLLADETLGSGVQEPLHEVFTAGQRAASLTSQLLTFSRRQPIVPKTLDLNAVVGNVAKMLKRVLGENITVHFEYAPDLPPVHADTGMMEQVLMNLAVNARDAMPKSGRLSISTSMVRVDAAHVARQSRARAGDFVRLTIRDTGCGMPPVIMARIFEPFFTTKGMGKGTGLGLATVYGIVSQHQGWIEVESQVGAGTTFEIFLPALPADARPAEQSADPARPQGGSETILLVEDEDAVRDLATAVLAKYGYRVFQAATGEEALAVWKRHGSRISLLLTDMVMPGDLNGWELAQQLLDVDPALKVIYTSGYSDDMTGNIFSIPGKIIFLQKPYRPSKLAQSVRQALDSPTELKKPDTQ